MSSRTIKLIHVLRDGYSIKSGNYCVKMEIHNEGANIYFLSPKQWFRLSSLFSFGEDGNAKYSNRDNQVYGVFEDDRFVWAGTKEQLGWLEKTFNAELAANITWRTSEDKKNIPILNPLDNIEILPELRDNNEEF